MAGAARDASRPGLLKTRSLVLQRQRQQASARSANSQVPKLDSESEPLDRYYLQGTPMSSEDGGPCSRSGLLQMSTQGYVKLQILIQYV